MSYLKDIIIEGSAVGISVIIVGTLISYIMVKLSGKDTKFLKNKSMYVALFLTGFILHIGLDIMGLNKWYCGNCAGCK